MSRNIYDNWEKLVTAVVKKQQLWELFHQRSRSPSINSEASDISPGSSSSSFVHDEVAMDFLSHGNSSWWQDAFAKLHPELVLLSGFNPSLDVEHLFLASSELIGRVTFGSVYTAAMENGVSIVVRRMKPEIIKSELEFKQNMEIVRNVKHENVVPLKAYYSSKEEKLLLYDHYSLGSVYSLLHGQKDEMRAHVDWETRMRIAIGAARGIDKIHTQNDGKFVHGNIKASNILMNSQRYGCVSDLGLANTSATPFPPTALCYAPETKNALNISQASDVYSFGILLLELLARKSPVHIPGGPDAVDLVKLVTPVSNKWFAVFDADLRKHPHIMEKAKKMLILGIRCVEKSPKRRPKMSAVVKMLEDITIKVRGSPVPEREMFVFVDNKNPHFDIEEMFKGYAEILGCGTFGISYKVVLRNGKIILVKRMRDLNVTLEEFEGHIKVIGRMRHENISELRAYYHSKDEKLLVYDYQNQSNVSTLLHGKGADGRRLDWASRLKIAIGTARGIAHIHKLDGRTFVHGNIMAKNIFRNEQGYGLIVDAGLIILARRFKPTSGYCAPEVVSSRKVSQASDVYSFGVVLLELVSGKPSQLTMSNGEVVSLVEWIQIATREEWNADAFDTAFPRDRNDWDAMIQLLKIGLVCVRSAPEGRPKMPQVVEMLDGIGLIYSAQKSSDE